jgi:hypothetical protein
MYSFWETWYGGADSVPFLEMDCNNYISSEPKKYVESKRCPNTIGVYEEQTS